MNIKHIIYSTALLVYGALMLTSCDKLLDEKSQDLYIPKTVGDYREFIAGEALNQGKSNGVMLGEYLDMMTDDIGEKVNVRRKDTQDTREQTWGYYTWQEDPEIDFNNTIRDDNMWSVCYHRILITNIVLDRLNEMSGTQNEKDDLEAEARFIRAWSYYMLANTYAKPYESAEQASKTAGVPINTAISVENKKLQRATLQEVYVLMKSDLTEAVKLFKSSGMSKTIFRPNLSAVQLLLSRVLLYGKEFQEVVNVTSDLIGKNGIELHDLSTLTDRTKRFYDGSNKEIFFSYGSQAAYKLANYISATNGTRGTFKVNMELLNMYDKKDKRRMSFFSSPTSKDVKPFKYYNLGSKNINPGNFHLSEVYLNRAEAYAELGQGAKAMDDVNAVRAKRIEGYTAETITEKDKVVEAVRTERRKELCFEGLRWFDLRRWGCPELKHTYSSSTVSGQKTEYVLKQGDARYTLPVPRAERELNNI
ncbi:SusD family protein [Prevotella sp. DNF00663]|uniref:RagB/SusD family nutrient uptake outer membrane protein n=1 Tax=unclassified Prevotella TaxID=2638335 RepID=UPI000512E98E|nr:MULTISPECIES: RagB/SusD family nutrient uptake outer membrane protein [unclassified Prevotella]KGI60489.1 SusD family protein [Prevotella sp. S7 MS 2]KXB79202.1 SusD family protein [Prevotella sp. DNF00663]